MRHVLKLDYTIAAILYNENFANKIRDFNVKEKEKNNICKNK